MMLENITYPVDEGSHLPYNGRQKGVHYERKRVSSFLSYLSDR